MRFFKTLFTSCLGTLLALVVLVLIGSGIGAYVANMNKDNVKANTVIKLTFDSPIPEHTNNVERNPYEFDTDDVIGLTNIIKAISRAKEDDDIKGIYMEMSSIPTGMAASSNLRNALIDFKESGKFVLSYANYYSQKAYYLASVSDKIYMHPVGGIDFKGFSAQMPFFKDMLDRLNVKAQIYHVGKYKSATEPFRYNKMSDPAREQVTTFLNENYNLFLEDISLSRKITVEELRKIADEYSVRNSKGALEHGFIDGLKYKDEIISELKGKLGLESDDEINAISISKYNNLSDKNIDYKIKDKVAVVYAEGSIVDGNGDIAKIGGDKYAKLFRKLREDKNVKAVVLRINSGGGSGLASDIMWRELENLKEAGKPVVASMSNVAASGGYYIACAADTILAEPNTLTGSIGVFGLIMSFEGMMRDKIGITFDTVKTGKFSNGISAVRDISDAEGKLIQESVEEFYDLFLKRVADGRKMTTEEVHEVAQGRVWTGKKAKELGLVDVLGGLDEAIEIAANLANLDTYRTSNYPKMKNPMEKIIEDITGQKQSRTFLRKELGDNYKYLKYLEEMKQMNGIQARMPFFIPD